MHSQNSTYEQKKKDAERKRHKTQIHEDNEKIIAALNRISDQQAAANQQSKALDKCKVVREWATIIGIYGAAIVAIGAIVVASCDARQQAKINKDAMIASTRAWIAPYRFKAPEKLEAPPNKIIEIDLLITNVGREPANQYTPKLGVIAIERDKFKKAEEIEKIISSTAVGKECESLSPSQHGITIYPGVPDGNKLVFEVLPEVVRKFDAGTHWVMGFGCIAYVAMDGPHVSKFCAILEPTSRPVPDNWRTSFCPIYNEAN